MALLALGCEQGWSHAANLARRGVSGSRHRATTRRQQSGGRGQEAGHADRRARGELPRNSLGRLQEGIQVGQHSVDPPEHLPELGLRGDQGGADVEQGRPEETEEPPLRHGAPHEERLGRQGVPQQVQRLALCVHQVQATEGTNGATLEDAPVLANEAVDLLQHDHLYPANLLLHVLPAVAPHDLVGARQGDGVVCVRGAPAQGEVLEVVFDALPHADHPQRQEGAREALGRGQDVGHHAAEVLEGE
mmetsp:Transcript_13610/g.42524  ORF Transcript_13610/g.42524 Transcript_13610/m.42524 type:complete len:247 (+) Transcript_13610:129-869(+)